MPKEFEEDNLINNDSLDNEFKEGDYDELKGEDLEGFSIKEDEEFGDELGEEDEASGGEEEVAEEEEEENF